MSGELADEHRDAAWLAQLAGRALLELRAGPSDARDIGSAGDRLAHRLIVGELNRLYPDDDVRSEEGLEHVSGDGRLWIVDPLDGTREFSELGRVDWAVHVALWQSGDIVAGAVALPAQGITLATPDVPSPPVGPSSPRIVVSRTRPPEIALEVRDRVGGTLVEMGSAGAKVASVVQGVADVYVHAGGQYEWDNAAPVAVAWAAGLHATRIDGSPLKYNQPDPLLPDLVVCRRELADAVLAVTASR